MTARPLLDLLTGPDAATVLGAALGTALPPSGWRLHQVHARPGAEVTAGYEVTLADGPAYLLASSVDLPGPPPPGVVRLDDGAHVLHVWRHPVDPLLPGLATACDGAALAARLRPATGADVVVEALDLVTYRPLRRAVVRARTSAGELYVKVLRPERAGALVRRHDLLATPGSATPRVVAATDDGLVVTAAARGASLAAVLAASPAPERVAALDPADLLRALDALPGAVVALEARPAWADRSARYARAVVDVHGLDRARVARLHARLRGVLDTAPTTPDRPTHGDLHPGNVLLGADGRVAGFLDLDTVGPGRRADDLGTFLAHLAVLPALAPRGWEGVDALTARCLAAFVAAGSDEADLRARTAAVVLSLAAGAPDATLAARYLAVAEDLLDPAPAHHGHGGHGGASMRTLSSAAPRPLTRPDQAGSTRQPPAAPDADRPVRPLEGGPS